MSFSAEAPEIEKHETGPSQEAADGLNEPELYHVQEQHPQVAKIESPAKTASITLPQGEAELVDTREQVLPQQHVSFSLSPTSSVVETSESDTSPLEQSQPSPREQTFLPLLHDRDFAAESTLEEVHMAVSPPQTPQTSRTSTEKLPPSQRVASLASISEACDIPLPASPASSSSQSSGDRPSGTPKSEEGNARSLRSASVAPGSYPDSDIAEDTPRQTPSLTPREQILDVFQSSADSESEKNRKTSSYSSETDLLGDRKGSIAYSISHNQADQTIDREHMPVDARTVETNQVEQRERSISPSSNWEHSISHPSSSREHSISHISSNREHSISHPLSCREHSISHPLDSREHSISHPLGSREHSISHPLGSREHSISHPSSSRERSISPSSNWEYSISHPSSSPEHSISHPSSNREQSISHPSSSPEHSISHPSSNRERSISHPFRNQDYRQEQYIPEILAEGKPNIESSSTDTGDNGTTALLHCSDDSSQMRLEYDKRRKSSITTSAATPKDGETVSMNENESLAESDAELSSMKPLLASTDKGIASDQNSRRSFEENDVNDIDVAAVEEKVISDQDPSLIRTSTNLPKKNSSASGVSLEVKDQGEASLLPFPKTTPGSQSSLTNPASPSSPGIAVKKTGGIQAPPLSPQVAPNTNAEAAQHQQEGKHFIPLGESDELQGPIKLPTNKRKIYLRKARYLVLREPILNVVLGRQIGSQAKVALRRLADGELIVIEPPRSL
ncbi:MAG: hypothetical protein LQ342_007482 [Letrouitia transgressa]|nr:MAG: hypothetical protein LQ342_007482 [Letrouitia transgressa]